MKDTIAKEIFPEKNNDKTKEIPAKPQLKRTGYCPYHGQKMMINLSYEVSKFP